MWAREKDRDTHTWRFSAPLPLPPSPAFPRPAAPLPKAKPLLVLLLLLGPRDANPRPSWVARETGGEGPDAEAWERDGPGWLCGVTVRRGATVKRGVPLKRGAALYWVDRWLAMAGWWWVWGEYVGSVALDVAMAVVVSGPRRVSLSLRHSHASTRLGLDALSGESEGWIE